MAHSVFHRPHHFETSEPPQHADADQNGKEGTTMHHPSIPHRTITPEAQLKGPRLAPGSDVNVNDVRLILSSHPHHRGRRLLLWLRRHNGQPFRYLERDRSPIANGTSSPCLSLGISHKFTFQIGLLLPMTGVWRILWAGDRNSHHSPPRCSHRHPKNKNKGGAILFPNEDATIFRIGIQPLRTLLRRHHYS